jgi:microcystin-dependent protein
MAIDYLKDLAGYEDIHFDALGTNQTFSRTKSNGAFQNIKKINASDIPLLLATRTVDLYNNGSLSAVEVDTAITQIAASLAGIHKFENESILDAILSAGSGAIISAEERTKLNSITSIGSGQIITVAERNKLDSLIGLTQEQIDSIDSISGIFPVGTVMGFPTSNPPTGFFHCNGQAVNRSTYSDLFAVIGEDYGNGDGSTTFNLPDYRGTFLRGWDSSSGTDPDASNRTDRGDGTTGDNVGTKQDSENKAHNHIRGTASLNVGTYGDEVQSGDSNDITGTAPNSPLTSTTGGAESRPVNTSIMMCIRYSL